MSIDETWRTLRGLEKKWIQIIKMPEVENESEVQGETAGNNNERDHQSPSPENQNNADNANVGNAETND